VVSLYYDDADEHNSRTSDEALVMPF